MLVHLPRRILLLFFPGCLLLWICCASNRSQADVERRTVASGVTLTQEIISGNAPLIVNVLRVDLHAPGVSVACGQANDAITLKGVTLGRESLPSIASRHRAVAAINADFFPFTGDPLGLAVRDGELLSEPTPYRACIGFTQHDARIAVLTFAGTLNLQDGTVQSLNGVNRVPHKGDVIALTPS